MAWTAPRTWAPAEVVTAALLNTHLRDNLKAIGDPWTSFTPTLTSSGTQPAPTSQVGAYLQAGQLVIFRFEITMSATVGTGTYSIALPVSAEAGLFPASFGVATVYDVSAGTLYTRTILTAGGLTTCVLNDNAGARVAAGVPMAFASGDIIAGYGLYEAA